MVEKKMDKILNLTQHPASEEQKEVGVFEPEDKQKVQNLLTFEEIPDKSTLRKCAEKIAIIAKSADVDKAMIGGAPFFMAPLEAALVLEGITPLYAFSKRVSKENEDGEKISIFKHLGFVEGATRIANTGLNDYYCCKIATCRIKHP